MDAIKGRGATHNRSSNRFHLQQTEADGDWLDVAEDIDGPAPRLRTIVAVEQPRTIIARNSSPDIAFDQSVNAYRGCEHPRNSCVKKRGLWQSRESVV